jgi:hypothetical protein
LATVSKGITVFWDMTPCSLVYVHGRSVNHTSFFSGTTIMEPQHYLKRHYTSSRLYIVKTVNKHTHTHTHTYIYIYIYLFIREILNCIVIAWGFEGQFRFSYKEPRHFVLDSP